jgi:transcriptional regulator with XRE-family HTH domain
MTQEQFAAKTGLRQSAIAKIEASTTGRGMQTAKIAKLAELLRKKVDPQIDVGELLAGGWCLDGGLTDWQTVPILIFDKRHCVNAAFLVLQIIPFLAQ